MSERHRRRFECQIAALVSRFPMLRRLVSGIQGRPWVLLRVPLGILLLGGGLLAVLPVFGLWMIPLGLLVLAMDLPVLRPFVSALVIRIRRKWTLWRRR